MIIAALLFLFAGKAGAQNSKDSVIETMLIRAVSMMETGAVENATKYLEHIKGIRPDDDAINYYLGTCYVMSGRVAEGEECIKAAIRADSTNVWYQDALANLYLNTGRGAEASTLFLDLMEKYPKKYTNAYTLTLLGNRKLSEYQDSLAVDYFDKALMLSPDYTPAVLAKSEAYRMQGNIPGFFAQVNEMVQNPGLNPAAKCDYINQLLRHIDYNFYRVWNKQLDSLVVGCVNVHPADTSALRLAGSWFYGTERKDIGRQYFERLADANPDNLDALYLKMQIMMDEGASGKEIIDHCEKIIKVGGEKNPKVLPAMAVIGDTYHQFGQDNNAFKAYERVLKVDPNYLPVLNNYAYYLSLKGKKLKKAAAMSKITVEKEPDNATYLDTYGWILYLQKEYKKAKPLFKHAMLYGGRDNAVILEHYSKVLEALGEYDLARSFRILAENKKEASE